MIRKILALCSRDLGHDVMYSQLRHTLIEYGAKHLSWNPLIQEAEREGVAPLLYKHCKTLDFDIPDQYWRLLQSLYLRNRRSNDIRTSAVCEILYGCDIEKIDVLIVKGIALCSFVYSETAFRPMRDIDLLVKKVDLAKAQKILLELGYVPDTEHDVPDNYYHLVPMRKTIDGLPISIELHHNLLPFHPQYPLWPLERSYSSCLELEINSTRARTLNLEDTLRYIYLHGFKAPLTYEPFRFVHVADIVSVVEKFVHTIDWQRIQKEEVNLLNVISCLHVLTPWQKKVSDQLQLNLNVKTSGPGRPYSGWPHRKLRSVKKRELPRLAIDTLWPFRWWMQIHYGHLGGPGYWRARFFDHPRMVWRWIKAYWFLYRGEKRE